MNQKKPHKYLILIVKNLLFISSLVINFFWVFLIALGSYGINLYPSVFLLLQIITCVLAPSFIFSTLIILLKNNSIQDWISGIKYDKNVRPKLIVRTLLKHICASLVFIFTCIAVMQQLVNFSIDPVFVVAIQALLLIVIDTIIIVRPNTYTSVFNIIVGIKK